MTVAEAKQIPIADYLNSLGVVPKSTKGSDAWYLSPLHQEKTPSFKVNTEKNIWYDFGAGIGGTIIDLVAKMKRISVKEVLAELEDQDPSFSFSPAPLSVPVSSGAEDPFTIVSVRDLRNPALLSYITKDRGIKEDIAKQWVYEIYFKKTGNDKNLFALAFKNDEGGYETRNALYKGNIGGKALTTLKGKGTGKVAVFEGFMDFLSVATCYNIKELTDDVIILNSLSLLSQAIVKMLEYEEVKLFLDNDKAGKEAVSLVKETHKNVKDCSGLYKDYKDANEWLKSRS